MNTLKVVLLSLLGAGLLLLGGCEQKGCTDPFAVNYDIDAQEDNGECVIPNLTLMLHQKVGSEDLTLGEVYSVNGYDVKFTLSQFYLSGFRYMDDAGNGYAAEKEGEPVYLLVTPDKNMYELGNLRAGHLHMLRFDVGVDSATNNQSEIDFASWPGDHPLALQSPAMHWSWNTGYIFLKIEGRIDFNKDGIFDADDKDIVYHIGLDKNLASAALMAHMDIDEGAESVMVKYDLAAAMSGIDLSVETNLETHTMNKPALAEALVANLPAAFSIGH